MSIEQTMGSLEIRTSGEGFTDITSLVNKWIEAKGILKGIINITSLHTSCSLIINENADNRVLKDLNEYLKAIVPEEEYFSIKDHQKKIKYSHSEEGIDDMPAHIKTALTTSCLSLSVNNSKLVLGTWQAIYLCEHRYSNHNRKILLHSIGEIIQNTNHNS